MPDDRTWNAGVAVRTADGSRRTADAGDEQCLRCGCSSPSCTVVRCYLPPGRWWRRAVSEVWMQQSVMYCGALCCRHWWPLHRKSHCLCLCDSRLFYTLKVSESFPSGSECFQSKIYTPILRSYISVKLLNFVKLSLILTKLCHIKRGHSVNFAFRFKALSLLYACDICRKTQKSGTYRPTV